MLLRSWMAAVVLVAGATPFLQGPARAQKPEGSKAAESSRAAQPSLDGTCQIDLKVKIAGLAEGGCDIEVKPGHRSCRFKAQSQHVEKTGEMSLRFRGVEVLGADRTCSFAITVREPGQEARTIYRAFRINGRADQPLPASQAFTCYLNSPSKLARLSNQGTTVR
ncbi:hypothetical protein OJF2_16940 [Aquisphaera giovannonii]|uniref:Uncharacterized protein n=1 Tax=Aquisphaera giovannonii TaxID=406548 RepID=A0A5B9VYW5_9BACT|nr:hypothetical protein [Aquisphaera giovannonii]QEH33197.1 hypothetical protein OJF2_16940 [Aquisphaera giovannonii]